MRINSVLAVAAMFAAIAATPAAAFGEHRCERTYGVCADPYAYQYSPRGYYPWYGSHYWVPARIVHKRKYLHHYVWNTQPPRFRYYPSWGYPSRKWKHREWHARHHGRIHRWHW